MCSFLYIRNVLRCVSIYRPAWWMRFVEPSMRLFGGPVMLPRTYSILQASPNYRHRFRPSGRHLTSNFVSMNAKPVGFNDATELCVEIRPLHLILLLH
ncbi:hypothetical protein C8R44DRAFT_786003 [Mycena epipterygia]|nr:hypothetical protein C8R44DRAFT_786003 [Mycena epipterygia]